MNKSFLADPLLVIAVTGVWGLFIFSILRLRRAQHRAVHVADAAATAGDISLILEARPDSPLAPLGRRLRPRVVGQFDSRTVLSGDPHGAVPDAVVDVFNEHAWLSLANAFTGIALVITFGLIAKVLFFEVGPAIGELLKTDDKATGEAFQNLSAAVSSMGLKFVISASGLLATLLHRAFAGAFLRNVRAAADEAARRLAAKIVGLDQVRLMQEAAVVERLERLSAQVDGGVTTLGREIARLHSIEVSVKDLGTEVTNGLAQMLNATLAERIAVLIEDMNKAAEDIRTDMRNVADAAVKETADQIVAELRAVNETLRHQAGSQVEQLLEKLQNVVTGGFSSASKDTAAQLAQFGEVIPRLGHQMELVSSRIEGVLAQMAEQQATSSRALETMAQASGAYAQQFAESLASSGAAAMERVVARSSQSVGAVLASIQQVLNESTTSTDVARRNMAEASAAIAGSLAQARDTAMALQGQMKAIADTMSATASGGQAMAGVAHEMSRAVAALHATVGRMGEVSGSVSQVLAGQQEAQRKQAELMQQMQDVWPKLLGTIADRVRESTTALGATWSLTAKELENTTNKYVSQLTESVEDLAGSVQTLEKVMRDERRQRTG